MIDFFVLAEPLPQPRPRVYATARGVRAVSNTARVQAFKDDVAMVARASCRFPLTGPLAVRLVFLLRRPKRLKGADRQWHERRPDIDNFCKLVLDACNGVCWVDDGQVAYLEASKRYAARGEQPGVAVRVAALEG